VPEIVVNELISVLLVGFDIVDEGEMLSNRKELPDPGISTLLFVSVALDFIRYLLPFVNTGEE